jgi:RNA polymerase sigma-70 factor, ECF subfamily
MAAPSLPKMYGDCIRAAGNHPSCDEFFRAVRPVLARVAARVAHQYNLPGEIDDLVQEISLKLVASGRAILHSLPSDSTQALAYFSVLAANSARDFFRARGAAKRGAGTTISLDIPLTAMAASLGAAGDLDKQLLLARIEEFLPEDRREQVVFRLYYRQGLTAREISSIPALALSVKGVESMIFRVTRGIRERLHSPRKDPEIVEWTSKPTSSQIGEDR